MAPPEDSLDPGECRACHGGGKAVSMLGGERQEVDCPWCEGTGRFIPEHDAQARRRAAQPAGDGKADAQPAREAEAAEGEDPAA
jgi:DnaJ-class molecular chaperone